MPKEIEGGSTGAGQKIGIVVSRFNDFITQRLQGGGGGLPDPARGSG